jgi:hypothetical protein
MSARVLQLHRDDSTVGHLERGVHTAPYVSLCRRPILIAIDGEGRLLASVVLRDDAAESAVRAELGRLVELYEPAGSR